MFGEYGNTIFFKNTKEWHFKTRTRLPNWPKDTGVDANIVIHNTDGEIVVNNSYTIVATVDDA